MSAAELLSRLSASGFDVAADGAALVVRPASRLTDQLRAELRAAKPELLALLISPTGFQGEAHAASLARPDHDNDPRVACIRCRHYRPGRCDNHRQAGLSTHEVGRDLAGLLQHCPGFKAQP